MFWFVLFTIFMQKSAIPSRLLSGWDLVQHAAAFMPLKIKDFIKSNIFETIKQADAE